MLRLGISGTNWTGKTTTLSSLQGALVGGRIDCVALSDFVLRCPYPMMEEQAPEASRWMVGQVQAKLDAPGNFEIELFDRTPVDILGFTHYTFDRLGIPADRTLISDILRLLSSFDRVFFVSPSNEWPVGVDPPPSKIGFALLMDWYMRRAIRDHALPIIELPWSLEERQSIIRGYLQR